jgi:hypothetical protein
VFRVFQTVPGVVWRVKEKKKTPPGEATAGYEQTPPHHPASTRSPQTPQKKRKTPSLLCVSVLLVFFKDGNHFLGKMTLKKKYIEINLKVSSRRKERRNHLIQLTLLALVWFII